MTAPRFFTAARTLSARDIASLTGASLLDPAKGGETIATIAPAASGGSGVLVFVEKPAHAAELSALRGGVALTTAALAPRAASGVAVLVTPHPQRAFAQIGRLLFPEAARPGPVTGETGVSPAAHVHPEARLEPGVTVEAGAVIGRGAAIGTGSVIAPGAIIGRDCRIGRDCFIGPAASVQFSFVGNRVVLHGGVRLGTDGFGYVPGPAGLEKFPQIGRVIVQDDVEVGANTTVDRGALDDTVIGEGAKIDNLVQIAHNVRIGRFCVIAGHSGVSGSVVIGDGAMLGGGVGIADHVTIGAGAHIAAGSGVMRDVPAGARVAGAPAKPVRDFFREVAALAALATQPKGRNSDDG